MALLLRHRNVGGVVVIHSETPALVTDMNRFFIPRKYDPAGSHDANQAFRARDLPLNDGYQIGALRLNIWKRHREVESSIVRYKLATQHT